MSLNPDTEAQLVAYVYGELSASAARAFEARLATDPALRAEVEGLKATRKLFGDDAAFGASSGVDAPPPHLVDAILNAELLARPAEIRQAALARRSTPNLTARLSRWLLGGGLVLAGAAAVLVVLVQPEHNFEPQVSSAAAPAPPPPVLAKGIADGVATGVATGVEAGAEEDAPRGGAQKKQELRNAELQGEAPAARPVEESKKEKERFGPQRDGAGPDTMGFGGALGQVSDKDGRDDEAKPVVATVPAFKTDEVRAKAAAEAPPAEAPMARPPAPVPVADEAEKSGGPAKSAARTTVAKPLASDNAVGAVGAGALAAAAPASAPREEPLPEVISGEELQRARRSLAEQKTIADKKAPISRAHEEEELDFVLTSADREFAGKRWLDALDLYGRAERLDRARSLGAAPVVGQLKCLLLLKRPAEAARLGYKLLANDVKQPHVVEGLVRAADAAAQVGDEHLERQIWTRLLEVPAQRSSAQSALRAIDGRRRLAPAPADASSESAAQPPSEPSAEPAAKR